RRREVVGNRVRAVTEPQVAMRSDVKQMGAPLHATLPAKGLGKVRDCFRVPALVCVEVAAPVEWLGVVRGLGAEQAICRQLCVPLGGGGLGDLPALPRVGWAAKDARDEWFRATELLYCGQGGMRPVEPHSRQTGPDRAQVPNVQYPVFAAHQQTPRV